MSVTLGESVALLQARMSHVLQELPPAPPPPPPPEPVHTRPQEPAYTPQIQQAPAASGPSQGQGGSSPYAIPAGTSLTEVASGTQAQPFDVTLSELATAVYGTRGDPPPGWNAVSDDLLQDLGVEDPQAWRLEYLGANNTVPGNDQEFRAEVYTDGEGNYVLSYRGTAEGMPDWENNFAQGAGFETTGEADKFSVTAVNTAREFASVFGNHEGGEATNLAITGHSQGGGLASVGSLASGVPAVTFDASGIHPNTFDRIGIDPQAGRDMAEGGQIRAYSLSSDALTNAQDSWATGVVLPDALGTQIVVEPAADDAHDMFTNYGPIEGLGGSEAINTVVEFARSPAGDVLLPQWMTGVGNIAYAAISHSPNALTNAMIDHQPWQPGYENPSSLGRDLQNLLPDIVKDDYARNVHDLITDVAEVVETDFAEGDFLEGTGRIIGDVAEGALNSAGDTVDGYADTLAEYVEEHVDGPVGSGLATVIDKTGDGIEAVADGIGQGVEWAADGIGKGAEAVADGFKWLGGKLFG